MNRARSPFFMVVLMLLALLGAAGNMYLESTTGGAPWKTPTSVATIQQLALILSVVSLLPLIAILMIESAIKSGWEPKWLRVRYVGVVILEKEADFDHPNRGWITVALPDKQMERFYADDEEFPFVEPTNVVMLEVIGQHVAEIKRMKGASAQEAEAEATKPENRVGVKRHASLLRPSRAGCRAWAWMFLAPVIGGGFLSDGILAIAMGSTDVSSGRRYRRHDNILTGDTAVWYGLAMILLGLAILGYSFYSWKRGWDPEEIEDNLWDSDDRSGCRPGRFW